tara:strand:+ start:72 stop:464 length:393 start_codon:yes stop_codon:yes gene_type:complete
MSYSQYKNIGLEPNETDNTSKFKVHDVKSLAERQMAIKNYPVVIIDNYTSWCGPCKVVAPKFAALAQKYEQKGILFLKENVENNFGSCPKIRGVPCFHFYVEGKYSEENTVVGADLGEVENNLLQLLEKK